MKRISTWSLLVLSLPTENATARMRYWRALKARGCAVLRDGVYLLPYNAEREGMLRELAESISDSGGTAHLLRTPSLDAAQEAYFRGLFDRSDDYDNVDAFLAKLLAVLTNIYPGTTKPVNSSDDGANHNNEARSVSVSTGVRSRLASRLFSTPVSTVYSAVTSEVTVGEGLDARLVLKRSSKWKSALRSSVNNTRVIVQFLPGFNLDTSPSPTAGVAAVQNAIDTPGSALRLALPKLSVSRTQAQTAVTVARCGLDSFKSDCALTAAQEDEVDEACGLDCTPGDDDSGGGGGGIDPTRIIVMVTVVSLVAAVAIIVMMLRARNRRSKRARAGQAPSGGIIGSSGGGGSGSVTGDAYGGVTTGGLLDEDEVDREFKALDCANVSVGRSFGEADCRHPSYDSTGIN